jgi:hypothetical protein
VLWPLLAAFARSGPGLALAAIPALAAPRELHVQGVGTCPTPSALAAALRRALPQARITAGLDRRPGSIVIELTAIPGSGGRYRVTVLGRERRFADPGGHCEERARAAAVFVALEVDPPRLLAEPAPAEPAPAPPAPAPPAPAPAPPAPPQARPASRVDLDLDIEGGPALLFAPRGGRGEAGLLALGMDLRAVLCRRAFCGAAGVAGLPIWPVPLTLPLTGASARLLRVPLHLSARARLRRGRFEAAVEVGGVLAVLLAEGLDLPGAVAPRSWDARLEGGVRLQGLLRARVRPGLALFFGLEAQVAPAPYALVIEVEEGPRVLGRTPAAWLGLQAGLSARALGGRF